MLSKHDIFVAYQAELANLEQEYGSRPSKEYYHEHGYISRKYAQVYLDNGHLDGIGLLNGAVRNFYDSGDKNELAATHFTKAQVLEGYRQLDPAKWSYESAVRNAPDDQKQDYQAALDAFLKRHGLQ